MRFADMMQRDVLRAAVRAALVEFVDSDASWWPCQFLKPLEHQTLSWERCLAMAVIQTLPAVLLVALLGALPGLPLTLQQLLLLAAASIAGVFVALRLGLARFWNRRAIHAAQLFSRREQWLRDELR